MNWITNIVTPKIKSLFSGSSSSSEENLWIQDPETGDMVFHTELESNHFVFPKSGYHAPMHAKSRLDHIFADGWTEIKYTASAVDPLKFKDQKKYQDRLRDAQQKTKLTDAVLIGYGKLGVTPVTVAVQDFRFMGGSLGNAAGEALIKTFETAIENKSPLILFVSSGGARIQEGLVSLMQMPRTVSARLRLKKAGLPYIVVLTNPTTGGVTASYAMLGDVHIAEPGARIGFAGPRVIEQTIREEIPEGFQRAESLYSHGMIDMVVARAQIPSILEKIITILDKSYVAKRGVSKTEGSEEVLAANGENGADTEQGEVSQADNETMREVPATQDDAQDDVKEGGKESIEKGVNLDKTENTNSKSSDAKISDTQETRAKTSNAPKSDTQEKQDKEQQNKEKQAKGAEATARNKDADQATAGKSEKALKPQAASRDKASARDAGKRSDRRKEAKASHDDTDLAEINQTGLASRS